jgi:AraC-like DNA-binding protein
VRADYQKVSLAGTESYRCEDFECERFAARWHFHPEFELTLIVSGRGMRLVGDNTSRFSDGDLVLVGPGLPHCWVSDPPAKGQLSRAIVVQFTEDFLGKRFCQIPELSEVAKLLRRAARGLDLSAGARSRTVREMLELKALRPLDRLLSLLRVLGDVSRLRARPLSSAGFSPVVDAADTSRMDRVHRYLSDHLQEPIHLGAVANVAHMTPAAFCRYFKRMFGKTLTELVNEMRIGNACRLLLEGDLTVAEACYASGYNNITHFNRQFRRLMGTSPRKYRQRAVELTSPTEETT